jgi:hypothetical protein
MKRIVIRSWLLASIFTLASVQSALAYIDPNTGGLLFQLLAVAFASISAVALIFSRQIRRLLARMARALRGLPEARLESQETSALRSSDTTEHPTTGTERSTPDADSRPGTR